MENEFINYMILLEETVAEFYKNIKDSERYEKIAPLLEFMEVHSSEHAIMIKEMNANFKRPVLDPNLITNYQNKITKKVARQVEEERDLAAALTILADGEEGIGKLYDHLTDYVKGLSDYYTQIHKIIGKIAKDEYRHRDMLLNDKKRLIAGHEGKE